MTDPVSQITVDDGTTSVEIAGHATLELSQVFRPVDGGSTITRFLDGTAIKQTSWTKRRIEIRGAGWVPSGLWDIDYSLSLTLTVQDPDGVGGVTDYTVFANPPTEQWDINRAQVSWSLIGEEV